MKKTHLLLFLLMLNYFSFAQDSNDTKKPKVVATASMIWDMAKNIGGDNFDIKCIVPIGGDPHLHKPTPRDVKLVASADLVLKNGLTFEGWLDELIENSGTEAVSIVTTDGITPLKSSDYHNAPDPHAWMDVKNALFYIKNIKDALVKLRPELSGQIEENYLAYQKKLTELDDYIIKQISQIPEAKRILITSHDAFQYYGQRYGIKLEAAMGVSTDADVQTSAITKLNKLIQESGVPAIFVESTINPKLISQVAKDNGVKIGGELFADSIGDEESGADSYINMMKRNTNTIVGGLISEKEIIIEEASSTWLYAMIGLVCVGGFIFMIRKLNN